MRKTVFLIFFFSITLELQCQEPKINWISFEQLEDSLQLKPKKIFISFFADWCTYCKKMERTAFKNKDVIRILNDNYYAVKLNAETKDTINFDDKKYINNQLGKSRKPIHQIPLLLASRRGKPFSLPANLILDKNFKIKERHFEYLSPKKMVKILE